MDKMREEFEKLVSLKNLEISFGNYLDDEYDATWTQVYWEGWQASRKALVVELPNAWEEYCGLVMSACGVELALDAAGVAYK